jgi:dTDP-4-amino-4,6-dideoxygalactose transaminase
MPATSAAPFRDLRRLHQVGQQRSRAALQEAVDSCDFARPNRLIDAFEERFAAYCGVSHAVATASGSAALLLTYLSLGIGPGDEIVTVPNTFVATAEAAWLLGATVRLVDIDPGTHAIDQRQAIEALSDSTKAVVPLHPYGRLADVEVLVAEARRRGVAVVEEACHAHGATRGQRRAGAWGDCAVFSFGPTKPLAGLGEGGAVVTDDDTLAERLRLMNNHGRRQGQHAALGLNFRIHPIEAAYLITRLDLLPDLLAERREVAARYNAAFTSLGIVHNPDVDDLAEHSFYVYVVDVAARDAFCQALTSAGVGWDRHYPVPIHRQAAHRTRFESVHLANCDRRQDQIVSLPMINGLSDSEVGYVIEQVGLAVDAGRNLAV